jgi:hypothetical protein
MQRTGATRNNPNGNRTASMQRTNGCLWSAATWADATAQADRFTWKCSSRLRPEMRQDGVHQFANRRRCHGAPTVKTAKVDARYVFAVWTTSRRKTVHEFFAFFVDCTCRLSVKSVAGWSARYRPRACGGTENQTNRFTTPNNRELGIGRRSIVKPVVNRRWTACR